MCIILIHFCWLNKIIQKEDENIEKKEEIEEKNLDALDGWKKRRKDKDDKNNETIIDLTLFSINILNLNMIH